MTKINLAALLFVALSGSLAAQQPPYDTPPPADAPYYRVRYEASTKEGELIYPVTYTLWVPNGVKTLRGVIVHQHGCGEGSCKSGQTGAYDLHWQALAKKHDCALLSPSYEQPEKANCQMWCDPRNGSDVAFQKSLSDLGTKSGHPELANVPWALWGHSGGGHWAGGMVLLHPDRIAAAWLRSGVPPVKAAEGKPAPYTISDDACQVPVMLNLGTKEGVTVKDGRFGGVWAGNEVFFQEMRSKGSLIGVSIDPNSSHDCNNQRYLAIPWFDACLSARLGSMGDTKLKAMPTEGAYLAPLLGDAAQPAAKFSGDVKVSVWLPNERVAKAWAEYVKDGNVSDTTPPPAPIEVQRANNTLTWQAEADFESGIAGFVIERDGVELARVPEKPTGSIGRPIFQKNGYSDSPSPPLAGMKYVDETAQAGENHKYRVSTVNSVGLKSEATPAQ
ncbi:MAG: hypothetical protein RL693_191 [Verrucomicrobiota bacterium]|jgi:pimeloyl-ACP methyl ester carboxylesterase